MRFIFSAVFCLLLSLAAFGQYNNKQIAEDFSATDLNGQAYNLADFRGKVVLLSFWSTRCPICQSEIPKLNRLSQKYDGQNVVFIGLSNENETKINAFLKKEKLSIAILILSAKSNRYESLSPLIPEALKILENIKIGEIITTE